jgi:tetratricopeptide (TPR) repeat protein
VAKYKKKRARELQHDRFRDTTMGFFDRLGNALEGRGRTILYALGGLILASVLIIAFVKWRDRKSDEAQQALGRAITISNSAVLASPVAGSNEPTFSSEKDRAQRAIEEFEKVAAKYGDPYRSESRYFIASNRLMLDRQKGMSELADLSDSGVAEVAALSKFALAQANESDGKFDDAAKLYSELARLNNPAVTTETANLRLAKVYEKQGKKKEAADLLFNIVDASRKAKGSDNLPLPVSGAAREAADELKKLDPDRYAQLPAETPVTLAG